MPHPDGSFSDRPEHNLLTPEYVLTQNPVGICIDINRFILGNLEDTYLLTDSPGFFHTFPSCYEKASGLKIIRRKFLGIKPLFIILDILSVAVYPP